MRDLYFTNETDKIFRGSQQPPIKITTAVFAAYILPEWKKIK